MTVDAHAVVPTGIGDLLWCWSVLRNEADGHIHLTVPGEYPKRAKQLEKVLPRTTIEYSKTWTTKDILFEGDIRKNALGKYFCPSGERPEGLFPLQLNSALEDGHRLDEFGWVWPEFTVSEEAKGFAASLTVMEPYLCLYMANPSVVRAWGAFTPQEWAEVVLAIKHSRDFSAVVLLGAEWDKPLVDGFKKAWAATRVVDLTGQTDLADMLAVAERSIGVVAFASGLPIMTTYHNVPTLMVYPKHLNRMVWTWPQPGAPYIPATFQYGPSPVASSEAVFFATETML